MRVVFVASECVPFSKTGGLADVVGALPAALAELEIDVQVIVPRYHGTKQGETSPEGRSLTIPLGARLHFASVQIGGTIEGVPHYLIDCPEFFDRDGLYQDKVTGWDYPDNHRRFAAFSLAALEFIKRLEPAPDIIHCHDWQTSLVPVYLRSTYAQDLYYNATRCVLTIHNLAYQGDFYRFPLADISLSDALFNINGLEYHGRINLLKGGLMFADALTTVSPKYGEEIQTPEFGYGLDGVLRRQAGRLRGILNGVDYGTWNPATDPLIPANYTPADLKNKETCKRVLLERMGLDQPDLSRPVLGIVSRFARQKGFDLIAAIAEELAARDLYLVVLGTGEREYEDFFRSLGVRFPGKFLVKVAYDNGLAHLIEAGSDVFLMPSRYEPSGLNQMYSLKYGTVPVVRATGGLENSVEDFNGSWGTGFKFWGYNGPALLGAISRALETYSRPDLWHRIMLNGMEQDFSWTHSAREYAEFYRGVISHRA
ncbi:MAG TPA: glycogen synthase GlgA [Terriglobia bacterium]|nr:glycogen synthase GlgA [Terriglobia bacterium]